MSQFSVLLGSARYEFSMQIRRRAVWITFILLAALIGGIMWESSGTIDAIQHLNRYPLLLVLVNWAMMVNVLLPVGVGVMLADRLPRDRRMKVDEVLNSLPGALSSRLFGKYLGGTLATVVPMFVFYVIGVGYILYQTHNVMAIPLALAIFATVILPGMLFVGAFSIACPTLLWVPLYQFLYVGYWFWGNLFPAGRGIPTLSDTILTPMGQFISSGLYHTGLYDEVLHATTVQAIESLLLLLCIGPLVMVALWRYLKWQQAQQ